MAATDKSEALRLSRAQREIWLAHHIDPANPKYNIGEYIEIRGCIDEQCFEAALRQVVTEAEVLNFRFVEHQGEPRQISDAAYNWSMPTFDLSTKHDPWLAAEAWMKADLMRPINLTNCPLFAFALFKTASDQYLWYLRFHHIVMDGFGRAIFAKRVAEAYTGLITRSPQGKEKFLSYCSYLQDEDAYLKSEQFIDDRKYWLERFVDRPDPTSFSKSFAAASTHFLQQTIHVSPSTLEKLRAIAQSAGATWKQVIVASVAAYSCRIIGSDDIVLTLPVLGRVGPSSRSIPGMMSNALPLRLKLHASMTLSSLVRQVSTEIRQLLHHQRYRGEDLRRDLCGGAGSQRAAGPIVNIMAFDYDFCFGGLIARAFGLSNGPVDDLSVSVYERSDGRGLRIDLDANPALYSTNELIFHQRHFERLLLEIIAVPTQPIGSLNLLEATERRQILVDWNDTAHPVPESTLPVLFEQQVNRTPRSIALMFEDVSLTYEELNIRANRLAHHLIEIGVGPEDIVALALERSIEMVISLWAIMKTGAAYLPLATRYPAERLSFMIQDAKPVRVVTNATIAASLPDHVAFLLLDDPATETALAKSRITNPTDCDRIRPLTPLNSAYVIYTSGSTGTPKGVVVSHTGIPSLAFSQIQHLAFTAESRLLQFISISFDASLFDLCLSTLSGARLILAPEEKLVPGKALAAFAAKSGVTHLNLPAAVLKMMSSDDLSACPNLIVGGEPSAAQVVERWSKGRRMTNAYGPTETTVCATMSDPLEGAIVPPIGRPIWNTRVYVLDAGLQPVPIGVHGELYIAGASLARGYLGNPGLTAERFIACPFGPPGARMYRTGDLARWRADGVLEFFGRSDQQVKIRGFRIEPGEVEAVLASIDGIAQAVVIPREIAGESRLVAYLVAYPDETLPPFTGLRATIAARLPDYMVPAHFVALDALPLTVNGKVDRRALPAPDITGQLGTLQPSPTLEAMLCRLFSELTGTAEVGFDDNFFKLGGSSFGAITLVNRINEAIGSDLAVRTLFEQPTIRQLADAISQKEWGLRSTEELRCVDKRDSKLPIVFLFPGLYGDEPQLGQFRSSLADRAHFVLIDYPDWHEMLASAFDFNAIVDACTRQIIDACGDAPVLLAGYSFGGCVASETAQRLTQSNYRVHFLGLIDAPTRQVAAQVAARSRAISWESKILRYMHIFRSKRSVQEVLAVFRGPFSIDRFIDRPLGQLPAPIARVLFSSITPLLPPELDHFFKRRLCGVLRLKYSFQWSPISLEVPTTLFRSDDPQWGAEYTLGWAKVCTILTVSAIGGDHETILRPPQLDFLCSCFIQAINSVR